MEQPLGVSLDSPFMTQRMGGDCIGGGPLRPSRKFVCAYLSRSPDGPVAWREPASHPTRAMLTPRLRPVLELAVSHAPQALTACVRSRLDAPDSPCRGRVVIDQIELQIRERDRRFWSPTLNVIVTPTDGGSRLRGTFGPNPDVWTLFLACYAFVVLSAVFGAFYGFAQWTLGGAPWGLLSIPIACALLVIIYIAAGIGQRLGHDQAEALEQFLLECVGVEQRTAAGSGDGP